ncbi:hypothetical protein JWZ98_09950 [Methylomonas sp. EFPC1]|uniref:DUF6794 domain-containing protein n=1 Tax=Methylomonas defluvii TaxID=3045149 RepID=A0ABU4UET2_9GAMM|nr:MULTISPECIES: DUF6794 domain-containing protein [unclassified Methylomonas]MDX8127985.1 DUF6794 domain-containing protein [Methylomonas sp. OY6]PKD39547.1 hypothetical protein CWO84_14840 [Methylomonas sp. Kb3]QSB03220.1 hypothetical protein JWZ98_09950 [Methylomonas sp. EFPC1]
MTEIWSALSSEILRTPRTVDEAVDRLLLIMNDTERRALASAEEDELVEFHFCLGVAIRYAFGLHKPESELAAACGTGIHPDDASGVIIRALWERLQDGKGK